MPASVSVTKRKGSSSDLFQGCEENVSLELEGEEILAMPG